jgi:hypothetical protein
VLAIVVRVVQDCVFWNTYKKTATLKLDSKWISEPNTIIGARAPARRADTSPMKPTAHTTVSKAMPMKANNAALLRVISGVYTYLLPSSPPSQPHLPCREKACAFHGHIERKQQQDRKNNRGDQGSTPQTGAVDTMPAFDVQ